MLGSGNVQTKAQHLTRVFGHQLVDILLQELEKLRFTWSRSQWKIDKSTSLNWSSLSLSFNDSSVLFRSALCMVLNTSRRTFAEFLAMRTFIARCRRALVNWAAYLENFKQKLHLRSFIRANTPTEVSRPCVATMAFHASRRACNSCLAPPI